MDLGDEQEAASDGSRRRKRYHRHTPRQIQQLEAMFKENAHPDENQRMQLSRELGLEPKQIKFWFQNRRTQLKAQLERNENCGLRDQNEKLRAANITMQERLKTMKCERCGPLMPPEDPFYDEQKLRMENARLKEELERMASLTSKYLGRPITQLPSPQLPFLGGGGAALLDLDILGAGGAQMLHYGQFPVPPPALSEADRPLIAEMATAAMNDFIRVAMAGEPLWAGAGDDGAGTGMEVLRLDVYDALPSKLPGSSAAARGRAGVHVEASRASGMVFSSAVALVDLFLDSSKWAEFFPTIVLKASTVSVVDQGRDGRHETLILMSEELHVLSPVVPRRELLFLRYCRQLDHAGEWAIADMSVDLSPERCRRRPSGCIIKEMPNGYSKVTWVEHMEVMEVDGELPDLLYRDLVASGAAFGAHRWVATLQRSCERFACFMAGGNPPPAAVETSFLTAEGRRSMMKLAHRMVSSFCANLTSTHNPSITWLTIPGNDAGVRVSHHQSLDNANSVVLCAATSLALPLPCDRVFSFFRDESTRHHWDGLSDGSVVQEVDSIQNGTHPGNCISLLRSVSASQNSSVLMLQESCVDASGALVVYAPIDMEVIDVVVNGGDPSHIPLRPSGFTILPDGRPRPPCPAAPSTSNAAAAAPAGGSLLTVSFQILVEELPPSRMERYCVDVVNEFIATTIQKIKAALSC